MENIMSLWHGRVESYANSHNGEPEAVAYVSGLVTKEKIGATVALFDLLYMDGTAEELLKADADGTGTYPACCMALESGADGDTVRVLWFGRVRNSGAVHGRGIRRSRRTGAARLQ